MYERARSSGSPLVLATIVATRGSTYRKAGAQMLIAPGGHYEGLLSGGCLEGDLAGHAASVLETGAPRMVRYDHSGDDDLLWGLGFGCEGGMDVWLVRLDAAANWEPLPTLASCLERGAPITYGMVLESSVPELLPGVTVWPPGDTPPRPTGLPEAVSTWIDAQLGTHGSAADSRIVELESPRVRMFVAPLVLARELLLIGGGPDTLPVAEFGATLGWRITVADHRPAYADVARFPRARRVLLARPDDLARHVDLSSFDAAVIMSHHLATDLASLATLAPTAIPYIGLLGPASRRKRLLADLDSAMAARIGARLHAPVGLALGGRDPASIALAIVAEIQAHFHGPGLERRDGHPPMAASLHVILLAAGSSSRFGSPKQLADVEGRPMLARAVDTVIELAGREAMTVVLGAHAAQLEPLMRQASATFAINPDYEQGIASSIRAGLAHLPAGVRGVLIVLADQIEVTVEDLRELVARWEQQPDRIVAARYGETTGAPAIFPSSLFAELAALQGDRGARALLSRHAESVIAVPMPSAAADVDTPDDLVR
jgi:xanthine/CO dehydrogenase XdhC/CoxF family maturation factor/CTP:molybdopterin cytidylyltransferase MocA